MSKKAVKIVAKGRITIDAREESMIAEFEKRMPNGFANASGIDNDSTSNDITWEIKQLDVGDFIVHWGNKDAVLVERKTLSDLNQSISQDGRYKEQKVRIMASHYPVKIYLVEGNIFGSTATKLKPNERDRIYGAIINTTIRDKIPVLRTESIEDSYNCLIKMVKSMEEHGAKICASSTLIANVATESANTLDTWTNSVKMSKKENLTHENYYKLVLRQIPGSSEAISQAIVAVYPSLVSLISAYTVLADNTKAKTELLASLQSTSNRKIGPVVSARIYGFLMATA
jgi:ERCC4-type nuclease